MMKNFLFGFCLLLAASTSLVVEAAGRCKRQLECPNPEACPESGFSYVSDCFECEGYQNTFEGGQQCFTRKIFNVKDNPSTRFLWGDIAGMLIWFCAAGVATACGVGGGGIYVPLGILVIGFAPKAASGLSQCSIFGASLGGLLLNLRNNHPFASKLVKTRSVGAEEEEAVADIPTNNGVESDTDTTKYFTRPIIDYDMALFLAPMEMAGAVLGVLIQKILPNWGYLALSAIILGFTAKKTYAKWWTTRAKEMAKQAALNSDATPQEQAALATPTDPPSNTPSADAAEEIEVTVSADAKITGNADTESGSSNPDEGLVDSQAEEAVVMDAEKIAKRLHFLERDARQYPMEKIVCFAVLWIGLTLLTFMKGGKGVPSLVKIDCTSVWYGVLIGVQFLWTFGFAAVFAIKILRETNAKKEVGYPFHEQDVLWDFPKTRFYAFFTFVAGIVAGLIGIGGGMVLGPLMLVMGIYPQVSTATTATMIVLTSSSVAILYITSGLVPWEYAVTFFCTCITGALIGKTYIDGVVKKTGKASILIFLLATIIAFATCGAVVIALLRLSKVDWCFDLLQPFCTVDDEKTEVVCAPGEEERRLGSAFFGDVVRGSL